MISVASFLGHTVAALFAYSLVHGAGLLRTAAQGNDGITNLLVGGLALCLIMNVSVLSLLVHRDLRRKRRKGRKRTRKTKKNHQSSSGGELQDWYGS